MDSVSYETVLRTRNVDCPIFSRVSWHSVLLLDVFAFKALSPVGLSLNCLLNTFLHFFIFHARGSKRLSERGRSWVTCMLIVGWSQGCFCVTIWWRLAEGAPRKAVPRGGEDATPTVSSGGGVSLGGNSQPGRALLLEEQWRGATTAPRILLVSQSLRRAGAATHRPRGGACQQTLTLKVPFLTCITEHFFFTAAGWMTIEGGTRVL